MASTKEQIAGFDLLQFGAEPVELRMAMAVRQARSAGMDINLDVVQVPADRHIAYPGRPC